MYVPLCCFHQEGGKSQTASADCNYPADHQQTDLTESPFFRPRDFLFLLRENLREQFSSPPHMPTHTCPPHTHSHTPELIRAEVEELKSDFNRRIKEVLFNSLFSAYYVAFLPLCFVKVGIFGFFNISLFILKLYILYSCCTISSVPLWLSAVLPVFFVNFYDFYRARSTMTCADQVLT